MSLRTVSLFFLLSCVMACRNGGDAPPDGGGDATLDASGTDSAIPSGTWQYDPSATLGTGAPGYVSTTHPLVPSSLFADTAAPLPTNRFFENFVLGDGSARVKIFPYDVYAGAQTLGVSLPDRTVTTLGVTTASGVQAAFGATETFANHQLTDHDLFSATLTYRTAGSATMTLPLVLGSPYVTARYAALTPRITTGGQAVLSVNGSGASPVTGTRFEFALNDGRTWVLYTSSSLTFTWTGAGLTATTTFTGDARLALIQDAQDEALLDAHAAVIPLGASLGIEVTDDAATVTFDFETTGAGELLMTTLPHQRPRLSGVTEESALSFTTIRGTMLGARGEPWRLAYDLPSIGFDAPRAIASNRLAAVTAALAVDDDFVPAAQTVSEDPYFGGKQLAKLARLVVIARALGQDATVATLLGRLKPLVEAWLDGTNDDPLVYDATWGGLITTAGRADSGADFGMGYYNDHHFHYGYHVYAAAVIAREDPAWAIAHEDDVLMLVRDITNPSDGDPYFPRFRHFDFFEGHSWAAGLYVFGDGRNQESTSEAVHAWYATYLYGLVTENEDLVQLSRVLLAMEIDATEVYWQVDDTEDIYPAPFSDYHCVGVLWGTKVDATTFFGANAEFVYGIQIVPVTPISEVLLDPVWIEDAWPQMATAAAGASQGWRGLLTMAHAQIDPAAAWNEADMLTDYDDGNSETNTLYWLATRP